MEIFIYFLPFGFALLLLLLFWKYVVWWEYLLLIGVSMLFTFLVKEIMVGYGEYDTEYMGSYITKVTHYDEWDEWIEKTCTREVEDDERDKNGNRKYHTETYDCSYREYHPEYWKYTDNYGHEHYFVSQRQFDDALREIGYPKMVFRDMNRRYYRIDGDAQDYFYDGKVEHIRALTDKHIYLNKVNNSKSIFKFEDISPKEAKELGLFDYPQIEDEDQDVILGKYFGNTTHKKFKYINAVYGASRQFRVYILVFNGKPYNISEQQRAYWQGGNKNELVVCIGYDEKSGLIKWCNAFSWCDKPTLEVATERYFREHNHIANVDGYGDWLKSNLKLWKRKEFHDFDYIENEISTVQTVVLFILTFILDLILSIVVISNEFTNKELINSPFLHECQRIQCEIGNNFKKTWQKIRGKFC